MLKIYSLCVLLVITGVQGGILAKNRPRQVSSVYNAYSAAYAGGYDPTLTGLGYNPALTGYGVDPMMTGYNPALTGYDPMLTGLDPTLTGYDPTVAGLYGGGYDPSLYNGYGYDPYNQYYNPYLVPGMPGYVGFGDTIGLYDILQLHLMPAMPIVDLGPNLLPYDGDQYFIDNFPPLSLNYQVFCDMTTAYCAYYYY